VASPAASYAATDVRRLDQIGYNDETVPCTRRFLARWIFVRIAPDRSRRMFGWVPRWQPYTDQNPARNNGPRERTKDEGYSECKNQPLG